MRPEEFTVALRDRAQKEFHRHATFVRRELLRRERRSLFQRLVGREGEGRLIVDPSKLRRFMSNPGRMVAQHGMISPDEVPRVNALIMAIYESRALNEYIKASTAGFEADPEMTRAFELMIEAPEQLTVSQAQAVFGKLLADDGLLTGPIRVMLEDNGIRQALQLPQDFTFETYIERLRRAIRDARSVDEVLAAAKVGPGLMACTWIGICIVWALLVAVQTVVAAQAYAVVWAVETLLVFHFVRTTTTLTVAGLCQDVDLLPPRIGPKPPLESDVANQTGSEVWVVVNFPAGAKRLPLGPGESTSGLGLSRVEAVIIGGKHNAVNALKMPLHGRESSGVYRIAQNPDAPARVTIRGAPDDLEVIANDSQRRADTAGSSGWVSPERCRYSMAETAAAYPHGLDRRIVTNDALDAAHFYKTLRLNNLATEFKGELDG